MLTGPEVLNKELLESCRVGDGLRTKVAILSGADVESRGPLKLPGNLELGQPQERGQCLDMSQCLPARRGVTPLMLAAQGGHLKCVIELLQYRAEVNSRADGGKCPMHFAAASGNYDVGSALLCARAEVSAHDSTGLHALDYLPKGVDNLFGQVGGDSKWQAMLAAANQNTRPPSVTRNNGRALTGNKGGRR